MNAHQWRQPLSIIRALMNKERVKILLEKSNADDVIRNYDEIDSQVLHLSRTISDFRDFFKPDNQLSKTRSSFLINNAIDAFKEHKVQKPMIGITSQADKKMLLLLLKTKKCYYYC